MIRLMDLLKFSDEALLRANIERSNFVALFIDTRVKRHHALGNKNYRVSNAFSILPISERNSWQEHQRCESKVQLSAKRNSAQRKQRYEQLSAQAQFITSAQAALSANQRTSAT
jgi:hypothetical protein